ncbi:hypothetical protein N9W89_00635 [Hellea sp.]|nr:hypothetical protein [Hellea sp.]
MLLFRMMMFETPKPFEVKEDVIAVELVTFSSTATTITPEDLPLEIDDAPAQPPPNVKPKAKPAPPTPPRETVQTPDILASSRAATVEDEGNAVPLPETGTTSEESQRAANQARIDEGLKALATELACFKGFTTDCADMRKDVFEEFQMTETDKVYTKKYAHTGMPVEFYGMSERQIRAKLNVPNAGENGLYIPFTNIGIDGGIWDALHGVNKGCEWKAAGIDERGKYNPIKDCPDYLPAAREDRDRRNKFQRQAIK